MINKLPTEIILLIKDYLWGSIDNWKKHLDINSYNLKSQSYNLNVLKKYRLRGLEFECEDEFYCPKCGEKVLFPFTREICWDCDPPQILDKIEKYPYKTWSAGFQTKLWINHRLSSLTYN